MTEKIEGLRELNNQLAAMGANASGKALRNALSSAALPVVKAAKANVPVGTTMHRTYKGRLVAPGFASRSIRRRSRLSRDKRSATVRIGVVPEAFYVVQFLEFGKSRIARQPWLSKAYNSTRSQVLSRFQSQLKRQIEKAARVK